MNVTNTESWQCHIHSSSSERCTVARYDEQYYHVIPVNDISAYSQTHYNGRNMTDGFWESFGNIMYTSPIAYATCIYRYEIFVLIISLFRRLDTDSLKYKSHNTPSDFIKRHIVTDGIANITLCNKHLIRQTKSKNNAPQKFYTRDSWIRMILMSLFPKTNNKKGLPTDTPQWVIDLLKQLKTNIK